MKNRFCAKNILPKSNRCSFIFVPRLERQKKKLISLKRKEKKDHLRLGLGGKVLVMNERGIEVNVLYI